MIRKNVAFIVALQSPFTNKSHFCQLHMAKVSKCIILVRNEQTFKASALLQYYLSS